MEEASDVCDHHPAEHHGPLRLGGNSHRCGAAVGGEGPLSPMRRCGSHALAALDYFGRELPLYFTKCGRCHRRRPISADEAAFRLVEFGVVDPIRVLHEGIPAAAEADPDGGARPVGDEAVSVAADEQLVTNRQRAFGRGHSLTFAARAQLAEAVGKSGDPEEAVRRFEELLADQQAAVGHQSPAQLGNRYQAAVWTARSGRPAEALTTLRSLLGDQEAILGIDHANTLITRATIAQLIGETGDREEAITMLRQVHTDQLRVLGSEDPSTEATQRLLVEWETG